ncbi:PKD domain-containing protein [Flavobacterium ustbae]|uniref:PKD domain-containing protein n=1 Tax=Flavobacterium ustbae TaxID=2488790 RepID=UPI000F7AA898|nr:gliding motility-associated C-terminal domain-containing protein [Flavobacterium ustbae]
MAHFYFSWRIPVTLKKLFFAFLFFAFTHFQANAQNCTVNAGVLNVTICETDALVLTGNTPSPIIGTVLWTQISGPAVVINSPNSPSTTISGYTGNNTYTFRYSATCADGVVSYQDKVVNVKPITAANAGVNIASCPNSSGTLTISANAPQNTGETARWEIVGANDAGVVINFPNLPTSTITLPATKCGVTTLQWVIEGPEFAPGQRCRTTSQITVTNYGGVKPVSAGPDQNLSNCYTTTQTTNLTATYGGCGLNGQSGQWTFVSGPNTPTISNSTSNTTQVSNLTEGSYTFRWTVTGPCAAGNDTVVITVPPATQDVTTLPGGDEIINFCDNSITQATLVAQTPLYAGETVQWTQVSGDSGAVIVSPTNPTTLITNISSAGAPYRFRYTLTNSNTGCIFTKDYIIQYSGSTRTIVANNGEDIVGSCNATVFTIPLSVTGEGINQYRIVNGPDSSPLGPFPTALQSVGSSVTLTLTASGDYTVEFIRSENGSLNVGCDYGFDTINILVSGDPTPSNAGTDVSLPCGDTSTILSGVSTDEGLHFWSQLSGPNQAVIADNFAIDTPVSGLIPGTYVFQYITKGGGATCGFSVATVTVYVSETSLAPTDAGTNQVVCINSQVPLTAQPPQSGEIGTWSQVSGPDTITFSDVNDPNAVASGFSTGASLYELQWTINYLHPGPSCSLSVSDTVNIITNSSTAASSADAGPDACYSSGVNSFNLSGNTPTLVEAGEWTVTPSTGVVFADNTDPNTLVTVPGNGTYEFTWTITPLLRNCISSSSSVSVTIAETPPSANAGPDQEICGNTITMAATSSGGAIGTWTRISGVGQYTISDIHDPNAVFTFNFSGYYIFRWTVDANVCGQAFDDINLTIGIPPKPAVAGPDQNVCDSTSVTMAGNAYDSFFELGQWSVLTGAPNQPTIVDPSNPNTVINGLVAGTYVFRWTISAKSIFLCSGSFDDVTVVVTPTANAGADQSYCDVTSVQLVANENSTGIWSLTSTTGNAAAVVITQSPSNSYIANATVVPGNNYVFTYTTTSTTFPDGSTCPGSSDSLNVEVYSGASIDPDAGADQNLCISDVGGSTTLDGNIPPADVAVSEWRFVYQPTGSVAVIDTPSAPKTTVSNLTVPGLYILEWVFESTSCRTLSDIVRIEMFAAPSTANAGPDDTIACQTTYKTAAVPPTVGIGTWSFTTDPSGGNAIIDSPNSPVTTLSNITDLGTYVLTWTVTNGPFTNPSLCQPSSDTVAITFNDTPPSVADAGPDQELCNVSTVTMGAQAVTSGIGTWTQVSGPNNANIASPNLENSLMLGLVPGTYEFLWTVTTNTPNSCISEDSVLVTIYALPSTAEAGPNQIVPQFTAVNMNAAAPSVGTGIWTQISGPSTVGFSDDTSPTTAITGTVSGTYILEWTVTNGNCSVSSDTMTLVILSVADLELNKSVTPMTGSAGDVVTFNLQVYNNNSLGGTVNATGVAIRDYIPTGYTIVPGSANLAGQYNAGDNTITWSNLTVPNGGTRNLTFKATIRSTGSYVNVAEVIASDQYDPDSSPNNQNAAEDDQDDTTIILDVADLSLQKTVSPTTVSIGDNVIFTIRVTNSGPNNASGITVSEQLPSGYTYVSDNGGGKYNRTTGVWTIGNLNNGNSIALQITAKVNVAPAANYVNTAEVRTANQIDPDSTPGNGLPEDDMSSATVNLKLADLELTKSVSPLSAKAGDVVDFTLNLLNNGPGNATGVAVQDIIPVGYTLLPGSVSNGGTYQVANAAVDWKNISLANGANLNLTFKATVNPTGSYLNTAQVTASDLLDPDSTPNNDDGDQSEDDESNVQIIFIGPSADLSLTKSVVDGNTSPAIGSTVSFELIVRNDGPNNVSLTEITDLLPSGYQFINYSSTDGIYDYSTGIWQVSPLNNGASASLIINARVLPTGNYFNTTQVTASDLPDPDSTPNNDDGDQSEDDEDGILLTPVQPLADLSLTKTVSNTTPLVGSLVTFHIITTNSGPQDAAFVEVTDLLPSGYTYFNFNATSGTYDSTTGIWSLDILRNTESETLQINAYVNPTGDYTNITEVTNSDTLDPDSTPNNGVATEDDYATATTNPVPISSDLSLTKTVNNSTPLIGSRVTFEIVVTNNGPQDNTGIQVTDLLPSGYTFNEYTISTGTYNPATGLWILGNIVTGKAETLQIIATVNPSGDYLNITEITASDLPDPNSTPNNGVPTEDDYGTATVTPIVQSSDLSLTKTVNNPTPLVGSQVTFEVVITNNGPQDNTGVELVELLPSGYTYESFTISTGTYNPVTGVWTLANIVNGKSETLQLTATVNPTGDYLNIAEIIASDLPDPDSTPNNGVTTEDDYATATTTPIAQAADLSLTKTVSNATPLVGSTVTFEVIVTNNGPQDTAGVIVTDLLPSGYTYSNFTISTGTYNPINGIWTIGNLVNGKSETLQILAIVNPTGNYLNTAEVTASSLPDPNSTPANGIATENDYAEAIITPIAQAADLSLTKTVSNATPLVGSTVTFEIVVTNNGPQDATGITVTDLLPSGYTFDAYSSTIGTYNSTNGLWTVGSLTNGGSHTVQISATVNPTGDYVNTAEVTATSLPDPNSTPNNGVTTEDDYASATITPNAQSADLALTKTVNNATPLVGSSVIFEIIASNNGPQNTSGVTVTDLLPSGYTFSSYNTTKGTYNALTGVWNIGSFTNGDSQVLQITAIVNPSGNYQNIAEVTASLLPDPNSTPGNSIITENDYASAVTTPIGQAADLSLTKTVNNATPLIESNVTFEIIVTNNGPQNTTGVEVTDLLPDGYSFNSFTATKGTYNNTTGKWTIGSLANGDSQTLQILATVNASGNYTNIAEVTASDVPDPDSTPNNGIATEDDYGTVTVIPTLPVADLSLTKGLIGRNFSPIFGTTIAFELILKNEGPQAATGVTIRDLLPSGYEYVIYSSSTGIYFFDTGIWEVGTVPSGRTETLIITVKVNKTGDYRNVAEVFTSNEFDPDSTPNNGVEGEDDMGSVFLSPVAEVADLSIEKTVVNNELTPNVGSQISFSITVSNSGPSAATGVTIKDILPPGYDFIFYNATSGNYNAITGEWTPGIILPGNSHTLILNVFVKAPTGSANEYLNTAEIITSDQLDPNSTPGNGITTEDDYDSISVTPVIVQADLSINKRTLSGNTTFDVGGNIIFEVTVTNYGPGNASGVMVKDLLPAGFTYLTYTATSGVYNFVTGDWNTGVINSGATQTLQIYVRVNPPTGQTGEYTNITEITASNLPDPDSTPNNGVTTEDDYDSLTITVNSSDLSLNKTVSNQNANVGEIVTYTLQIDNEGPVTATGVAVEDVIPLGLRNITNINNGGIFSLNTIKWVNLTVPVGGITLNYNATVVAPEGLEAEDYKNIAQVTASNQFDPDSTPNNDNGDQSEDDEDSEFITVPSTDIAINKDVDKTDVPMNSEVVFTITADNLGTLTATNVEVQDILPKGYSFVSSTATSGSYNASTGIWIIPSINGGTSQTLNITVKVVDFNDYLNTAHLTKLDQIDTNSSNNQDSASVKASCFKIYNEFSPNDDGQNDTFYIDCIEQYPDNQLEIFNRWGNLVYYKKGYDNTWDGKADGSAKTLPEGTYFYILDLGDGSKKTSGWLYLK